MLTESELEAIEKLAVEHETTVPGEFEAVILRKQQLAALLADLKLYKNAVEEAIRHAGIHVFMPNYILEPPEERVEMIGVAAYDPAWRFEEAPALATILKGVKG